MHSTERRLESALLAVASELEAVGANLTIESPLGSLLRIGRHPAAARVVFRDRRGLDALRRRDHLALAEGYVEGHIEVEGDLIEAVKVTEVIPPDPGRCARAAQALRLLLRDRKSLNRESIAFHYDRPPDFFLPWFERWRSYSHGFYRSAGDDLEEAQARKLRYALDALELKPGSHVLDVGCGWGSFLEFAGREGVHVHGITISKRQHAFIDALIREHRLPCSVELMDFFDYRPRRRFDGAVFMGSLEHVLDYRRAARFLAEHLTPAGRVYADFCAQLDEHRIGAFLARHVWPGSAAYVRLPRLLDAIARAGFHVHRVRDDTKSYALTVRDWADRLSAVQGELSRDFGEQGVRTFLLYLRAAQYYFEQGKTQAYHLVAAREPASLA